MLCVVVFCGRMLLIVWGSLFLIACCALRIVCWLLLLVLSVVCCMLDVCGQPCVGCVFCVACCVCCLVVIAYSDRFRCCCVSFSLLVV